MWNRIAESIIAAVATVAFLGLWNGAYRGESALRVAALVTVVLAGPAILGGTTVALLDRRRASASSVAFAIVLFLFAGRSMKWHHSDWAIFALRAKSIAILAALGIVALVATLALRAVLAWISERLSEPWRRRLGRTIAAIAMIAVAAGFVPVRSPEPVGVEPPSHKPNLLLVTIETLRADHLSVYGYTVHRTPNLDRVAAAGIRFNSAYSTAPWTLPSLSSVMTGYLPSALGIHLTEKAFPSELPTVAETLLAAGYDTHAIVTNIFTARKFRLDKGFRSYDHLDDLGIYDDLYHHPIFRLAQKVKSKLIGDHAGRLTDHALAWLRDRRDRSRPFFLWLHYIDPHEPYGGPQIRDDLPCQSREAPEIGYFFNDHRRVFEGKRKLTPVEKQHLVHLYDAEIRFLDRQFGRLLDFLEQSGLDRQTLLTVTGDHGEEFWDHGSFEHGHSVHVEVVHVPLFFRWPGVIPAGRVVDDPVSLLDLMPTLLTAAGAKLPETQARPMPLDGDSPARSEVVSENIYYGRERKAIRDRQYAVILDPAEGKIETFDRRADPMEMSSLDSATGEPLSAKLAKIITANEGLNAAIAARSSTRVELSDFEREQLRALGYVE